VNINKNINGIEYAALGLSALGTVAAVVTQQIAYIATPLTLSLSLSLINRQKELARATKRLTNLEQQFASEIESIVKQSQTIQTTLNTLPAAPTSIEFEQLATSVSTDRQELKRLGKVLIELEQRGNDLVPFLTEIDLTKDSLKQLSLNFSNFEQEFDRRQNTINSNSTDRALGEIRSNVRTLTTVNSTDRDALLENLSLNLSELELDSDSIYLSIEQSKLKIQLLQESSKVAEDAIKQVGWRFLELEQAFMERQDPMAIVAIDRSLTEIIDSLELISADLSSTKADYILKQIELSLDKDMLHTFMETTNLKIRSLEGNSIASDLVERVNDLDISLGDLHDYNLKLTNRIDNYARHEIIEIINAAVSDQNISNLIQ
jgi:hypothetical protein